MAEQDGEQWKIEGKEGVGDPLGTRRPCHSQNLLFCRNGRQATDPLQRSSNIVADRNFKRDQKIADAYPCHPQQAFVAVNSYHLRIDRLQWLIQTNECASVII